MALPVVLLAACAGAPEEGESLDLGWTRDGDDEPGSWDEGETPVLPTAAGGDEGSHEGATDLAAGGPAPHRSVGGAAGPAESAGRPAEAGAAPPAEAIASAGTPETAATPASGVTEPGAGGSAADEFSASLQHPEPLPGVLEIAPSPPTGLPVPAPPREVPASYRLAYDERRTKSVLELQPWRRVSSADFTTPAGRNGVATLVDLNPAVGAWLLLRLEWVGGGDPEVYHLENPFPGSRAVRVDTTTGTGVILGGGGERVSCDLWGGEPPTPLAEARASGRPFAPLCGERLYLRNRTDGRRTSKEWAADFLRDRVWGGERITSLVRDTIFRDRQRRKGRLSSGPPAAPGGAPGGPLPPQLAPEAADRRIEPSGLGLTVEREASGTLVAGRWYPVTGAPAVSVSAVRPDLVELEIVAEQGSRVNPLDPKEASALVYVVAFDLDRLELGFALGTEHPRVNWSERALDAVRDETLPGPDGIGTVAPLVRTGMLSPAEAVRVVATFAGGFKRSHGAFRYGELASRNQGSHYGFIEEGAILGKLQPGLATITVSRDGHVMLRTWSAEDDQGLPEIRYARQNGVPLLETDPANGKVRPGNLVKPWGAGNWSGSADKKLRTLRAGACLQEGPGGRFLLYGLFTSATPSAMARVFEAYRCRYALLLDMNALEHTYLAVYREEGERRVVERLIDDMAVLDRVVDGATLPRFVGFPDNRDFFFLLRRHGG